LHSATNGPGRYGDKAALRYDEHVLVVMPDANLLDTAGPARIE
jgi:hypothetical protein